MKAVVPWFLAVSMTAGLITADKSLAAAESPMHAIVSGNTAFALELYQREKGKQANLFLSPYSISTALAMTWAGARGQTAEEMARVLQFGKSPAEVHQAFAELTRRCDQINQAKQVNLSVANSLWCQRGDLFVPAFLDLNRNCYRVEARLVNFAGAAETVRREINAWVERETHDKIQDLLQPGQVDSMTRLVLCNAIYFKGHWADEFDPLTTRPGPFYVSANQSITVSMMSRELKLRSHAVDGATLFALPYTGKDLSMIILLPAERDGLSALEQRLSADALRRWLKALAGAAAGEARVFLPKFKLNCRLDLAGDLAAMGMTAAFTSEADFSGMNGKRNLYISGVAHQAFVEVNEEGTEAAAATGVTMRATSMRNQQPLRVDHPFLFLIVEQQTGSILFLGRVTDPTR